MSATLNVSGGFEITIRGKTISLFRGRMYDFAVQLNLIMIALGTLLIAFWWFGR